MSNPTARTLARRVAQELGQPTNHPGTARLARDLADALTRPIDPAPHDPESFDEMTGPMPTSNADEFAASLSAAADTVKDWPRWKRNILGRTLGTSGTDAEYLLNLLHDLQRSHPHICTHMAYRAMSARLIDMQHG